MKLSELSTDRALDTLCELTPYLSNIASDATVVSAVGKVVENNKELNTYGYALLLAERMGEITPVLLKTHRPDVYGILSVLNEKSTEEIAAQSVKETLRQIREAFQDTEFLSFFKSSVRQGKSGPSAPSAPSPVSE